jgi:hypothetical protein
MMDDHELLAGMIATFIWEKTGYLPDDATCRRHAAEYIAEAEAAGATPRIGLCRE